MALTCSGSIYRSGFGPLMGGVSVMPFPYVSQGPYGQAGQNKSWPAQETSNLDAFWGAAPPDVADRETARCLEALELMLRTQSSPTETAAILIEPVQGEGGYLPTPPGYLRGLREICDKHNLLLICDEVQTGFGRTGTMFASEWVDNGITPDILVCAKGIANGYPISAVASRSELSAKQPPGSMGGTYGGNAVSCAAAHAVLDAFEKENILQNVNQQEKAVRGLLQSIQRLDSGQIIREVRGKGLMIGVEFERLPGKKHGETAGAVVQACLKRDLMVLQCGPYDTLRIIPRLNSTDAEIAQGMDILKDAVTEVHASAC